jgi:hypothetical protein
MRQIGLCAIAIVVVAASLRFLRRDITKNQERRALRWCAMIEERRNQSHPNCFFCDTDPHHPHGPALDRGRSCKPDLSSNGLAYWLPVQRVCV